MPALIKKIWQETSPQPSHVVEVYLQSLTEKIDRLEHIVSKHVPTKKISVPDGNGHRFIAVMEILYIKAQGNYCNVFLVDGSNLLISKTLKAFGEHVPEEVFLRCHAGFLVNSAHIKRTNDTSSLELSSGEEIPISRRKYQAFIEQFSSVR